MTLNTEKHFFDYKDLLRGCAGYIEHEKRDAMYKLARKLIKEANWRSQELAEGLGVLLLTWNAAFYTKYGSFDFDVLEDYLKQNTTMLKEYSERNILSYSNADDNQIQTVFKELLEVTKSVKKIGRTPVGVSKTLHLLAPNYFSLWDTAIAKEYKVYWYSPPDKAPKKYTEFQSMSYEIAKNILNSYITEHKVSTEIAYNNICNKLYPRVALEIYDKKPPLRKSLIKMIDEYNFAKYKLKLNLKNYDNIISRLKK